MLFFRRTAVAEALFLQLLVICGRRDNERARRRPWSWRAIVFSVELTFKIGLDSRLRWTSLPRRLSHRSMQNVRNVETLHWKVR
jgi:hypothetical protein